MKKFKKIICLLMALTMIFSITTFSVNAASNETEVVNPRSISIASCVFRNFESDSGGSTVTLSRACNYVSFQVNCASGSDSIIAVITDLTYGGAYNTVLTFEADGSTTTFETYFGSGSYTVRLYGANKTHTLGLVAFST